MKFSDYNKTFSVMTVLVKSFELEYLKYLSYKSPTAELLYNNNKFSFKCTNTIPKTQLYGNASWQSSGAISVSSISSMIGSQSSSGLYNCTSIEFNCNELISIHVYNTNGIMEHSVYFSSDLIIHNDEPYDVNESMIFQRDSNDDSINLYAISEFKKEINKLLQNKNKE